MNILDIQPDTVYGLKTAISFDNLTMVLATVPERYWKEKLVPDVGGSTSIADIMAYLIYRAKHIFIEYLVTDSLMDIYERYQYDGGPEQYHKLRSGVIKVIRLMEEEQKIFGLFRETNKIAVKIDALRRDYGRAERFINKCAKENGWISPQHCQREEPDV